MVGGGEAVEGVHQRLHRAHLPGSLTEDSVVVAEVVESEAALTLHQLVLRESLHDAHRVLHALDIRQEQQVVAHPLQQPDLRLRAPP